MTQVFALRTAQKPDSKVVEIMDYIQRKKGKSKQDYVFLPSIMALAGILNCSALEIHDVFLNLLQKGYKMLSLSMDSPITLLMPQS